MEWMWLICQSIFSYKQAKLLYFFNIIFHELNITDKMSMFSIMYKFLIYLILVYILYNF